MNESQRLAKELEKALFGEAWYGPSWKELLAGVSGEAALRRPLPKAHTIAEIVAHATTWFEVVELRLRGETPKVSDEQDWPNVMGLTEGDWSELCARSLAHARALVETVRGISPEILEQPRPGLSDTWFELISGELQHLLYHAGQVGLLKKAVSSPLNPPA
jgi:DinB superfamily